MIAPNIPEPMCISTGTVPQWYANAPANFGVKRYVTDSPFATERNASFGLICAAWKSIECGIAASLVSVNSTVSPTRVCTIGPGMSPSNVHAATTVSSEMRTGTSFACQ